MCTQKCSDLKCCIMEEGHQTPYSIHLRGDKLYKDLKKIYWWISMKREVAEFVSQCLVCQKVKIEHQRPMRLLQPLEVPRWKWDSISMDFVSGLPRARSGCDTIQVVVDRLTKSVVDRLTKSVVFIPMKST